jgi:hypothetical protein
MLAAVFTTPTTGTPAVIPFPAGHRSLAVASRTFITPTGGAVRMAFDEAGTDYTVIAQGQRVEYPGVPWNVYFLTDSGTPVLRVEVDSPVPPPRLPMARLFPKATGSGSQYTLNVWQTDPVVVFPDWPYSTTLTWTLYRLSGAFDPAVEANWAANQTVVATNTATAAALNGGTMTVTVADASGHAAYRLAVATNNPSGYPPSTAVSEYVVLAAY